MLAEFQSRCTSKQVHLNHQFHIEFVHLNVVLFSEVREAAS